MLGASMVPVARLFGVLVRAINVSNWESDALSFRVRDALQAPPVRLRTLSHDYGSSDMSGLWRDRQGRRRFILEASPSLDQHTIPTAAQQGRAQCNSATDADGGPHASPGTRLPTPECKVAGVGECRSLYRSVVPWWGGVSVRTADRSDVSQPGRALQELTCIRVPGRPLMQQYVAVARPVIERAVDVGDVAAGASADCATIDRVKQSRTIPDQRWRGRLWGQ